MKLEKSLTVVLAIGMALGTALAQQSQTKGSSGKTSKGFAAMFGAEKKAGAAQDGRNWWGVKTETLPLRLEEEEEPVPAAEVVDLTPGGPAAQAGLHKGDIIVGVQMRQLTRSTDLAQAVAAVKPGGRMTVQLIRSGEPMELTVVRSGGGSSSGLARMNQSQGLPATPSQAQAQMRTGIFINKREITPAQVQQLRASYGYVAPPGNYWYDSRSGLYGVMGREAAGFMRPGHNFGPLPSNASNGTTGVFINGRQINMVEAMYIKRLFGAVYQGRWWLDGRTGNLGAEGSSMPIANVYMALQQSQRSSQGGGGYGWHSRITGASGNSDGNCGYVQIPGTGTVSTCN